MTDEKIIERIRRLLAMAEHEGSNENEASIALEMAQKLLLEHNLSRTQVLQDGSDEPEGVLQSDFNEFHGFTWKASLLNVLAKNTLCHVVTSNYKKEIHIFGSYDNLSATLGMYHWIVPQLETMVVREYIKTGRQENAKSWKNSFFYGAINTISSRLKPAFQEFSSGTGREVCLRSKQEVDDLVREVFPHLHKSKGSYSMGSGYFAGATAGKNVTLSSKSHLGGHSLALGAGR